LNGDRAILRCVRRCDGRFSASSPPTGDNENGESTATPSDSTPSLLNLNSFLLGLWDIDEWGGERVR
jgi:hypothetical protein